MDLNMDNVLRLVESGIVIPVVAGSSPVGRPTFPHQNNQLGDSPNFALCNFQSNKELLNGLETRTDVGHSVSASKS